MIQLNDVSKVYDARGFEKTVFANVDLRIERGDALGICGANGAGKSTLMRVLAGVEQPTTGTIYRAMTTSWPIGYANIFQSSLTGADNARFIARIYGKAQDELCDFVEDFAQLGSYFRQPINTYSAGMSARLAFGISLAIDFDCYLVDEITGAGDERFRARSQEALVGRRERGTLVMISHETETLKTYCTRGAVLYGGALVPYDTIDEACHVHHRLQARGL